LGNNALDPTSLIFGMYVEEQTSDLFLENQTSLQTRIIFVKPTNHITGM